MSGTKGAVADADAAARPLRSDSASAPTGALPKEMRAAWYERLGPAREVLTVGRLPVPMPRPDEILIKIGASGVNPHNVKERSGWLGNAAPTSRIVPHGDGAGTVVLAGTEVAAFKPGDRVFVFGAGRSRGNGGTAAEFVAIPAANATILPDDLSFAEGASLGAPAFTAYYALLADGPVTGLTVLIQGGAGACGLPAIELARWNGATVITTVSSEEKAAIARAAGADHVVNYRTENVVDRVMTITAGRGVDRIVEVDFGENIDVDAAVIRSNGTVASYSSTRVTKPVFPYYRFALKGVRIHLVQVATVPPDIRAAGMRTIAALLTRGLLRPRVARRFALDGIADAHELMEQGGAIGNIVIDLQAPDAAGARPADGVGLSG